MTLQRRFDWRVFLILWVASIWGVIAIIPYSLALQANALQNVKLPMPLWILIPIQVAANAVIFAIAIGAGLFFARRIGLGTPVIEGWLAHAQVWVRVKRFLLPSIILGVVSSLVIIGLDVFVFAPAAGLSANVNQSALKPAAWQGFLASFYGGINEEILMRLFLLSMLAFVGKFISHTPEGRPTLAVLWIANIIVAVIFGLGHLPTTSLLVSITPLIVLRAVVLNGLVGLICGYLYWTHGLESAMLTHFSADIVLHVIFAL